MPVVATTIVSSTIASSSSAASTTGHIQTLNSCLVLSGSTLTW